MPTDPSPLPVSVIIPARDAAPYIARAIASILTQRFADFELVVVDDGSSDETRAIAEQCVRHDSRARVLFHERPRGIPHALNLGLAAVTGQLVARLDADDIATPDRLEKQVAFMRTHPEVGMVGGAMVLMNGDERKLTTETYLTDSAALAAHVVRASVIASPTSTVRRELLTELGGWRPCFDVSQDYDLTLRISERAALANVKDVMAYYRIHPEQVTSRRRNRQKALAEVARTSASYRRAGRQDPIVSDTRLTIETLDNTAFDQADRERLRSLFSDLNI